MKTVYVVVLKMEHFEHVDTYGFQGRKERRLFIEDMEECQAQNGLGINYATCELKISGKEFKAMFKGLLKKGKKK